MPDTVHVPRKSDVNGVLPHIERHRRDVCIPADIVHREIGGDVEQPVQRPKLLDGGVDELRELGFLGDIEYSGHGLSARGPDLISDSPRSRLAEIRHGDLHAFLRKAEGCGAADVSRRRSGHDGYLVPKSSHGLVLDQLAAVDLGYSTFRGAGKFAWAHAENLVGCRPAILLASAIWSCESEPK